MDKNVENIGLRVILAETLPAIRSRLHRLVGSVPGVAIVAEADNTSAVLELVELGRPEVLLLDLQLPGMNMLELLRCIKTINPYCQVFMLARFDGLFFKEVCLREGADDFFEKTCELDRLVSVLDGLVHSGSMVSAHALLGNGWESNL